jgi:hypothetical protein
VVSTVDGTTAPMTAAADSGPCNWTLHLALVAVYNSATKIKSRVPYCTLHNTTMRYNHGRPFFIQPATLHKLSVSSMSLVLGDGGGGDTVGNAHIFNDSTSKTRCNASVAVPRQPPHHSGCCAFGVNNPMRGRTLRETAFIFLLLEYRIRPSRIPCPEYILSSTCVIKDIGNGRQSRRRQCGSAGTEARLIDWPECIDIEVITLKFNPLLTIVSSSIGTGANWCRCIELCVAVRAGAA